MVCIVWVEAVVMMCIVWVEAVVMVCIVWFHILAWNHRL